MMMQIDELLQPEYWFIVVHTYKIRLNIAVCIS